VYAKISEVDNIIVHCKQKTHF